MKAIIFCCCLIFMFSGTARAAEQKSDAEALVWKTDPRVSAFHDALQPFGEWFKNPQYGWSWQPYNVSIDWRPYTQGHWIYTDY